MWYEQAAAKDAPADPAQQQAEALAQLLVGVILDTSLTAAQKKAKVGAMIDAADVGGKPQLSEQSRGDAAGRALFSGLAEQTRERERQVAGDVPPTDPRLRREWLRR